MDKTSISDDVCTFRVRQLQHKVILLLLMIHAWLISYSLRKFEIEGHKLSLLVPAIYEHNVLSVKISKDNFSELYRSVAETTWNRMFTCSIERFNNFHKSFIKTITCSFKSMAVFYVLQLPSSLVCISHYCPALTTQKLVKIIGIYSIDAFVMLKSVTNDNFSTST